MQRHVSQQPTNRAAEILLLSPSCLRFSCLARTCAGVRKRERERWADLAGVNGRGLNKECQLCVCFIHEKGIRGAYLTTASPPPCRFFFSCSYAHHFIADCQWQTRKAVKLKPVQTTAHCPSAQFQGLFRKASWRPERSIRAPPRLPGRP